MGSRNEKKKEEFEKEQESGRNEEEREGTKKIKRTEEKRDGEETGAEDSV